MKAVVDAFNQEKALVGAFSVITNLRMELFQALYLGRRDYVDHVTGSDPVDGVVNIDQEFLHDKRVVVQLVCSFR